MNWLAQNWWQVALVVFAFLIWREVRAIRSHADAREAVIAQAAFAAWKQRQAEGQEAGDDLIPPGAERFFQPPVKNA